ncbi:hypothetical protein ACFE04_025759 [Oxalis oulophora]
MDMEQEEMQFLGFFGIYKESFKIILTWRKIFTKITLTFILPLCFIFLAHIEISDRLFYKIRRTEFQLDNTPGNTQRQKRLSQLLSSEWTTYLIFQFSYLTFFLVLSLLSTAAVVYTVASIYTGREVSFRKVMSVVPKVWKRLMLTFIMIFVVIFVYNIFSFLGFILWAFTLGDTSLDVASLIIIMILYFIGFLYITVVWQMASVVSVLEDLSGIKAMIKGKTLLKGKFWIAMAIFLKIYVLLFAVKIIFPITVVYRWSNVGMVNKVMYGLLCFSILFMVILVGIVVQTVIYFVCKSYHHENIDKSALSDHLEVFLGEYVPLTAKDVQLEQFHV